MNLRQVFERLLLLITAVVCLWIGVVAHEAAEWVKAGSAENEVSSPTGGITEGATLKENERKFVCREILK